MNTKHIRVISVAIVTIFVIAILQLIVGVVSDHQGGSQKADDSFNMLMVKISNAAARYEPGSPEFTSAFNGIRNTTTDIASIRLKLDGMQLYEYPGANAMQDFSNERLQTYSSSTRTTQGRTLSVEVAMYAVRPYSIYYRARISFVLILAGTIGAAGLLMYLRITGDSADSLAAFAEPERKQRMSSMAPNKRNPHATEEQSFTADGKLAEVEQPVTTEAPSSTVTAQLASSVTNAPTTAATAPTTQPTEEDAPSEKTVQAVVPTATHEQPVAAEAIDSTVNEQEVVTERQQTAVDTSPSGTVASDSDKEPSPQEPAIEEDAPIADATANTNFPVMDTAFNEEIPQSSAAVAPLSTATATFAPQFEVVAENDSVADKPSTAPQPNDSGLEEALAAMLSQAQETDEELSLIMIRPTDESRETTLRVKGYLEEKLGGLGVVRLHAAYVAAAIRNTTLETALAASEALRKELREPCTIGISARAERDISAQLLIAEATQAVEHANEASPIIAFRVNPEKYRQFLLENS